VYFATLVGNWQVICRGGRGESAGMPAKNHQLFRPQLIKCVETGQKLQNWFSKTINRVENGAVNKNKEILVFIFFS
jgi:hypothetical protein